MSDKQLVLEAVGRLPETATLDEIREVVAVLAGRGRAATWTPTPAGATGVLDLQADADPGRPTWADLTNALLDVRKLEDDWDGQGAPAPDPALVDGAITLARDFQATGRRPADFAVAGVNGTVYFEWHLPGGYLEVEVTAPDRAEGRFVRKGSDTTEVFDLTRGL